MLLLFRFLRGDIRVPRRRGRPPDRASLKLMPGKLSHKASYFTPRLRNFEPQFSFQITPFAFHF
jgi:hypothetical protein